ncbi:hypothetical protein GmHk_02G004580 [Glycine max]|nr:hypothetical protein GmHk_02G004580 [Glycine max]
MSVLELYIEKDVVGGSMFHSVNSLTSCGNNLSNNELQPPRNVSNLHGDEDDNDDLVSNSYVEESLEEDNSADNISDTDDEVIDMIQPVRIVHPTEACGYVSMNYYQYIDVVYTNEHILKAYSTHWWPLGNEAAIPPSDDAWTLIPDPTTIRAKGWSRSTRIRNEMDWVEPSEHRQKCSRCGAEGHNRRQCPMQSEHRSCSFN